MATNLCKAHVEVLKTRCIDIYVAMFIASDGLLLKSCKNWFCLSDYKKEAGSLCRNFLLYMKCVNHRVMMFE